MRLQLFTIMLGFLVSALGCATCGNSLSCCDSGMSCDGLSCGAAIDCGCVDSGCDSGGCCEVIYDGPVYMPAPAASQSCVGCNSGIATMNAPVVAAPANTMIVEPQVVHDTSPVIPSVDSIARPNSVPAPEPAMAAPPAAPPVTTPKSASPTKPVKNILPSIISEGT